MKKSFIRLTYFDGLFFALMVGTTESYALYHFAQKGISNLHLGLLTTLPILLAALTQIIIPRLYKDQNLIWGISLSILFQAIGIGLLYYVSMMEFNFFVVLTSLCLFWVGGQNVAPLWLDFVGTKIENHEFSDFISKRNTFVIISTLFFFLISSQLVKDPTNIKNLFLIGLWARILSLLINIYIHFKYKQLCKAPSDTELNLKVPTEQKQTLTMALIWGGVFRMAVGLSSPFFLTYMINDLKLSTAEYVGLASLPFIGRAIFQRNWALASSQGRAQYGIQVSMVFISSLPWLWTLSSSYLYLMVLQLLSGVFWGGLELTQLLLLQHNFYGNSRKQYGLLQATNTIFATMGAILGGILLDQGLSLFQIFNASSIGRLVVAIVILLVMRKIPLAKLTLRGGTVYLISVLSLRASPANSMRAISKNLDDGRS